MLGTKNCLQQPRIERERPATSWRVVRSIIHVMFPPDLLGDPIAKNGFKKYVGRELGLQRGGGASADLKSTGRWKFRTVTQNGNDGAWHFGILI